MRHQKGGVAPGGGVCARSGLRRARRAAGRPDPQVRRPRPARVGAGYPKRVNFEFLSILLRLPGVGTAVMVDPDDYVPAVFQRMGRLVIFHSLVSYAP